MARRGPTTQVCGRVHEKGMKRMKLFRAFSGRDERLLRVYRVMETVTQPGFGQDVLRPCGIVLNLLADQPDIGSQVFILLAVLGSPDRAEKLRVIERDIGRASCRERVRRS